MTAHDKMKEVFGVWNNPRDGQLAAYARFSEGGNGYKVYNARSGRSLTLHAYQSMPELLASEPFKVNPDETIHVVHQDKTK